MHAHALSQLYTYTHSCMHGHAYMYTHLFFRFGFFNWGGKPLRSFLAVPQAVHVVFLKIFQEFQGSEIVVKLDVVILSLQI